MVKKRIQHKKKHSRYFVKYLLLLLIVGGGIYSFSNYIYSFFTFIHSSIPQTMGFSIDHINISGANKKTQRLIFENIGISKGECILKLSTQKIFSNISKINWVKSVVVQKILPNSINIKIKERTPIAIFQNGSGAILIDKSGNLIEKIKTRLPNIPIISGGNANFNVKYILDLISQYKDLRDNLDSLTYIRERRWNIILSGIKVLLPETEIEKALEILSTILKTGKINKNTVSKIDLRTPENVIFSKLKLTNRGSLIL